MATIQRFEDLEIWKLARLLCNDIRSITIKEPFAKEYRLRNQIESSSGSIMDNIAEGFERNGNREFIQFLAIAKGSCGEVRSQLYRALDYGHLSEEEFDILKNKATLLSQSISNFMNYLKKSEFQGNKFKQS